MTKARYMIPVLALLTLDPGYAIFFDCTKKKCAANEQTAKYCFEQKKKCRQEYIKLHNVKVRKYKDKVRAHFLQLAEVETKLDYNEIENRIKNYKEGIKNDPLREEEYVAHIHEQDTNLKALKEKYIELLEEFNAELAKKTNNDAKIDYVQNKISTEAAEKYKDILAQKEELEERL